MNKAVNKGWKNSGQCCTLPLQSRRNDVLEVKGGSGDTMIGFSSNDTNGSLEQTRRAASSHGTKSARRWADIETEIRRLLRLPQSAWIREIDDLKSETLVFLVRQIRDGGNEELFTKLITELSRRIVHIASAWIHFDETATKDAVDLIQVEVLRVILTEQPAGQSRYLETGFAKAVKRRAINAFWKYKGSIQDHMAEYPVGRDDGDGEVERPIEEAPDASPGPANMLLAKQDKEERERLYLRARRVIKDKRQWRAIILYYVEGWPIATSDPAKDSLVREFALNERTIRRWLSSGMEAMREALGVTL